MRIVHGMCGQRETFIHIGVGFDVVRFDKMGNVKASERGTDNR